MLEVKGTLAKLLAQEDLIVEHRQVETAQFDVERRVLTLPNWEKATEAVLDMLISHEVGHALYTPNEWDHLGSVPQSYVNVCEDIRIEKLIKRRYPGIPKTFRRGYEQFSKDDFFRLEGEDITKYSLADRLNLFFKIGHFVDIPFFNEEEEGFKLTAWDLETFEEVLQLAKDVYTYDKEQKENQPSQTPSEDQLELPSASGSSTQSSIDDQSENTQEGEGESDQTESNTSQEPQPQPEGGTPEEGTVPQGGKRHEDGLEAKTDSRLSESIQELVDSSAPVINYVQFPTLDLDQVIQSAKSHLHFLDSYWEQNIHDLSQFDNVNEAYREFKSTSNREVNYLVKEFECRKSAAAYARTLPNRTGVLDTKKLHAYRYNDDIFKKINITPNGKNHGLIFNLDWSGSMSSVIFDTVKQTLNLVAFCRKVKIPYEVYIFTNEWSRGDECWYKEPKKEGDLVVGGFNLVNVLSSTLNTRDQDKAASYLFRLARVFNRNSHYPIPQSLHLSGTPLNEALIAMRQIIPQFQKQNKVEKVHLINLTDGEGSPISRWTKTHRYYEHSGEDRFFARDLHHCQLRDRKLGRIYPPFTPAQSYYGQSDTYVQNLRDLFPNTNVISIRLVSGNDFNRVNRNLEWEQREAAFTEWKKHKSFIDTKSCYTRSLYIHSKSFDESANEFVVADEATKAQIKRAFTKSLKNKKTSKRILSEFISLVA